MPRRLKASLCGRVGTIYSTLQSGTFAEGPQRRAVAPAHGAENLTGVRRSLAVAALALPIGPPLCVFVFICGVGFIPAPRETCTDKFRRCVIEEGRPVAGCGRESVAYLGPWGGPRP